MGRWPQPLRNFRDHVEPPVDAYLEIGVWRGGSLFPIFEHLRPRYCLAVDAYPAYKKQTAEQNRSVGDAVWERWRRDYPDVSGEFEFAESSVVLPRLAETHSYFFDLIYVDGSHDGDDVLADAVNCWPLLKTGGLMVFDDWGKIRNADGLRLAVDAFVRLYWYNIFVEFCNWQVGIRKTGNFGGSGPPGPSLFRTYGDPVGNRGKK